jgi:hypothetical protein
MHPVIAQISYNLGNLLRAGGDQQSAQGMIEIALRVDRHNLGATHPDVARDLNLLAAIRRSAGDELSATKFEEQARAIMTTGTQN